jgi:hypothetical protein
MESSSPHPLAVSNATYDDLEYPNPDTPDEPPSPRSSFIHKIHLFLDVPKSSTPVCLFSISFPFLLLSIKLLHFFIYVMQALWYAIVMLLIILGSTVAFLVSSLPKYYKGSFL